MKAVCRRLLIDGSPSTFWHCFLGLCLLRTVSRPCYTSGVGGIQLALQLSSPSVPGGSAASLIHSIPLLLQSSPGTASCNSHASAFRRGKVLTGHILCRGDARKHTSTCKKKGCMLQWLSVAFSWFLHPCARQGVCQPLLCSLDVPCTSTHSCSLWIF